MKKGLLAIVLFSISSFILLGQNLISEEFESASVPSGWTNGGVFTSTNNFCAGSRSLAFNGTGDFVITPLLVTPGSFTFEYKRSSNTTAWSMDVEYSSSTSGPWTNITTISSATTTCQMAGPFDLSAQSNIYIRFIDTRSTGANERYIDNVLVTDRAFNIRLDRFNVYSMNDGSVEIKWNTASENNNSFIAVERSSNGATFQEIGRVAGNGTTAEANNYSFTDHTPLAGANYYRLKQVDFDGSFEYSPVRVVFFQASNGTFLVYPTMANDYITVRLPEPNTKPAQVRIVNTLGQIVKRDVLAAETYEQTIQLDGLVSGEYMLIVQGEGEVMQQARFFKM